MRKMLKHIGIPIAIASIAAIVALAWTMILSPAQAVAQSAQEARAYITVQISTGDDSVSWSDPDGCSSGYNIYLTATTPVPGSSTGQTTRTHIDSAPSGSTQATLAISHSGGSMFAPSRAKVELYCGEYSADSSQNVLVASTSLSSQGSSLPSSTFSSAPLTALSVGSGALSPSFNRGIDSYSTDATLSGLSLSDVNFGTFASGTTRYSALVANSVSQTTVTPTVNDSGASYVIKLGGVTDSDGIVPLSVGSNFITIEVTAEDGETTKTYSVRVLLLAVSVFGITSRDYAENGTTRVATYAEVDAVDSTITWSLSGDDSGDFTISSAGVLRFSTSPDYESPADANTDNVYRVTIQASDGTSTGTLDVTVTVTNVDEPDTPEQLPNDATLSGLSLSDVNFGTFASGTESYTASVANSVSLTTVTPILNDSDASYVIKLGA